MIFLVLAFPLVSLYVIVRLFIMPDVTKLIRIKYLNAKAALTSSFDYTIPFTTLCVIGIISFTGFLFYKFTSSFFAHLLTGDAISFFTVLRRVFTPVNDQQDPLTLSHFVSGLVLPPAILLLTFYLIQRAVRAFMYHSRHWYDDRDVLTYGLITPVVLICLELLFYSQNISLVSGFAHFTYLSLALLPMVTYYLAVVHLHYLSYDGYRAKLFEFFSLGPARKRLITSKWGVYGLVYLIGLVFQIPFYSGVQFFSNNAQIIISIVFLLVFYGFLSYFFFRGGFNGLAVFMLKETKEVAPMSPVRLRLKWLIVMLIPIVAFIIIWLKPFVMFLILFCGASIALSLASLVICLFIFGWYRRRFRRYPGLVTLRELLRNLGVVANHTARSLVPMSIIIFLIFAIITVSPKTIEYPESRFTSAVLDTQGRALFVSPTNENVSIPLIHDEIPEFLLKCLYWQEDRGFKNQGSWLPVKSNWHGFSLASLYRIVKGGGGGSNINMQLIKNLAFDHGSFPQDIQRKFSEFIGSYQLSLSYSPEEIETFYLNTVGFDGGRGHSGLLAASLDCFGYHPQDLNPLEMMYLVTTLKYGGNRFLFSGRYLKNEDPLLYQNEIKEVLVNKAEYYHRIGLMSDKELSTITASQLRFVDEYNPRPLAVTTNLFLTNNAESFGFDNSSLVSSISAENEAAVGRAVKGFEQKFRNALTRGDNRLYSSALAIDIRTGQVLAHHGGNAMVDLSTFSGGNQMASLIKPLIIMELLEKGIRPSQIKLFDGPRSGRSIPRNYSGGFSNREIRLPRLLSESPNAPYGNLADLTPPRALFKSIEGRFKQMGIEEDVFLDIDTQQGIERNYPLGLRRMTLIDIAQAYQAIFNKGKLLRLNSFQGKVNPSGGIDSLQLDEPKQVYSANNAEVVVRALRSTVHSSTGTGRGLKKYLPRGGNYFAKTGTSDGFRHGYTLVSDGKTLVVAYVSYGAEENGQLKLGKGTIPGRAGGSSAGVLAAMIMAELDKTGKKL